MAVRITHLLWPSQTTPYYTVVFKVGGDSVAVAFDKHIKEFERVYKLLNALDEGKLSMVDFQSLADELDDLKNRVLVLEGKFGNLGNDLQQLRNDLAAHINSSNPHPNLLLDNTQGTLDGSRIRGVITNAHIPAANVDGLQALLDAVKCQCQPNTGGNQGSGNLTVNDVIDALYPVGLVIYTPDLPYTLPNIGTWECSASWQTTEAHQGGNNMVTVNHGGVGTFNGGKSLFYHDFEQNFSTATQVGGRENIKLQFVRKS